MDASLMLYCEAIPSDDVSDIISSFWEFKIDARAQNSFLHTVFPDGCVSLVYHCHKMISLKTLLINSLTLKPSSYTIHPGESFWGMRISPAVCQTILGKNPSEIQTMPLEFAEISVPSFNKLSNKLADCKGFSEAVEVFENSVRDLRDNLEIIDKRLVKAVNIFNKTAGQIKIAEVAKEIGLSPRQFQRNFLSESGLTPKQFARICRIRATAINLVENLQINWAHRAAEFGYADQAHLTHELSSATGHSPKKFAERVSQIKHGDFAK